NRRSRSIRGRGRQDRIHPCRRRKGTAAGHRTSSSDSPGASAGAASGRGSLLYIDTVEVSRCPALPPRAGAGRRASATLTSPSGRNSPTNGRTASRMRPTDHAGSTAGGGKGAFGAGGSQAQVCDRHVVVPAVPFIRKLRRRRRYAHGGELVTPGFDALRGADARGSRGGNVGTCRQDDRRLPGMVRLSEGIRRSSGVGSLATLVRGAGSGGRAAYGGDVARGVRAAAD